MNMRSKKGTACTAALLGIVLYALGAGPVSAQNIHTYTFDNGDPQGWVGVDVTALSVHFSLETYGGRGVVWCGKDFGISGSSNPGYGNSWDQYLTKDLTLPAGTSLTYVIQYDTEQYYDYVYVELSSDGGNTYTSLASYTGNSALQSDSVDGFVTRSHDLSAYGGMVVVIRFRFNSDAGYSDEDGLIDTNGAFRLDEVQVAGLADTFDTDYSGWVPGVSPGLGGEFRLVETPECSPGTPCDPADWPYSWSWVAYDSTTGVFPFGPYSWGGYQMAAESPTIPITPVEGATYKLEFNVYMDLPYGCGVYVVTWVACPAPEDGGRWKFDVGYYGTGGNRYWNREIPGALVDPNATSMKVRLGAVAVWYYGTPPYPTTPSPFFDNISIVEEGVVVVPGAVAGTVTCDDPSSGTPMYGVKVNAYDTSGDLVGTTFTDESGWYEIPELDPADYTISVVAPLGYSGDTEASTTILGGQTTQVDFAFTLQVMAFCPRTIGYWKHQVKKASPSDVLSKTIDVRKLKSAGPLEGTSPVCEYLDLIATHFNGNLVNEVAIYVPPASGECTDKLDVAGNLLNLHGAVGMEARAKQQLMALLLNTASGCLPLTGVISEDGAVVTQAITFCDNQIDAGTNLELAKDIADYINNGWPVPAGWIPPDTPVIFYEHETGIRPTGPFLAQNHPNPFRSATAISFRLAEPGEYALVVFDVAGRMVRRFLGRGDTAEIKVFWDGRNAAGQTVAPGIYYYRLMSPGFEATRKALVMR
jgi:hypothetical protein